MNHQSPGRYRTSVATRVVLVVGSATMIIGGLRALRQRDLKLLLAYGTVSQLGFMMLLFGTGEYKIAQAGIVLLLAHGAFKATLFMLVGIIDHQVGTRHIRELHGFGAGWTSVKVMTVIGARVMTPYWSTEKARLWARDQNRKSGSGRSVKGRSVNPKKSV